MQVSFDSAAPIPATPTLHPRSVEVLNRVELLCRVVGVSAAVVRHGLRAGAGDPQWGWGLLVIATVMILTISVAMRYKWSLHRPPFALFCFAVESRCRFAIGEDPVRFLRRFPQRVVREPAAGLRHVTLRRRSVYS